MRYLSSISLALIVLMALVACSSTDIEATVEARLGQERAIEATVEARVKKEQASKPTATPWVVRVTAEPTPTPWVVRVTATPTVTPTPTITPTPKPKPTATRVRPTWTPIPPTWRPTQTPTMAPSPTPFPTGIWNLVFTSQRLQREGKELKAIGDYISALRKFDEAITVVLFDTSWKGSIDNANLTLQSAFLGRGDTYRDMNMPWEAIDDYTKAIGIFPIGAWYSKRGIEYEKAGLTFLAQKDFNEACRLDSSFKSVLPC